MTRINYPCGPFKHTLSQNIVLKIISFGLELWKKKHSARPHSDKNSVLFMT